MILIYIIVGLLEETVRLQQRIEQLTEEKDEVEAQASKSKQRLEEQIHTIEGAVEEQILKSEALSEERKIEIEDLRNQIEMAEKQQRANKQFLDVSLGCYLIIEPSNQLLWPYSAFFS